MKNIIYQIQYFEKNKEINVQIKLAENCKKKQLRIIFLDNNFIQKNNLNTSQIHLNLDTFIVVS